MVWYNNFSGDYNAYKKRNMQKQFKKNKYFTCPYCKNKLLINENKLTCKQNHNFDISKKGSLFLINTKKYRPSPIYDTILFKNRREFIENKFYNSIYNNIANIINKLNINQINNLDLGCGEGLHSKYIQEQIKKENTILGLDYSKDAINMATDYLKTGNIYFVADINNIPLSNNSIDIILDFLSPYNTLEVNRVLKDNGYIIKIVPGNDYLKELRKAYTMNDYEKKNK